MPTQVLRIIDSRTVILPASMIPVLGFGEVDVTVRSPNGPIITAFGRRAYKLCCECSISEWNQSGGVCTACLEDIETILAETSSGNTTLFFTPEQIAWLATPCWRHFSICEYPYCAVGCCPKHITLAPDGHKYCRKHFDMRISEMGYEVTKHERGGIVAKAGKFLWSLFLNDDDLV